MNPSDNRPIGFFDSGVGGLSVLNAARLVLPGENLIYLGDTARVPYGTKSPLSITRYAEQALKALLRYDIKALVVACNTASAVALDSLQSSYPALQITGVVAPGAEAAVKVTRSGKIGVIATESTVNNQAYQKAILSLLPDANVKSAACSLFVALAEEGWHEGELVEAIVKRSLSGLFDHYCSGADYPDTLVLGCTHFPALKSAIARVVGEKVSLVDSAVITASVLSKQLTERGLLNSGSRGCVRFLVTDGPERFARVARHFYSETVEAEQVELIDIQHFV
ncbi:glutamate racemase [Nitrincola iocasae]|jgi:glutamate racemase|uniref:Glutamate racemase n=1 Tax=Nitrincola iocasae TaxID=2614693 RepID=A0A5J6LAH8_9GAMM|nr:glutamate racemase [Nitrincola iocasae]QEW05490.1 glutamate racemase [Nitrincola iocasae]